MSTLFTVFGDFKRSACFKRCTASVVIASSIALAQHRDQVLTQDRLFRGIPLGLSPEWA